VLIFTRKLYIEVFVLQMYTTMAQYLNDSNDDKDTKIVVITGAGDRSFTSGYDLACLVEDSRTLRKPEENGAT